MRRKKAKKVFQVVPFITDFLRGTTAPTEAEARAVAQRIADWHRVCVFIAVETPGPRGPVRELLPGAVNPTSGALTNLTWLYPGSN